MLLIRACPAAAAMVQGNCIARLNHE